jgi:hypothetical protein
MKITDPARDAILQVMRSQELDPEQWYLEFAIMENGAIGIGFVQQPQEQTMTFGDLKLSMSPQVDSGGFMIDYHESDGRRGLLFGADQDCENKEDGGCDDCGGDCQCGGNCGDDCKCKQNGTE